MNLDDLLNEMSEKMRNRDLSDEYLREHNNSTREEIGIGEYAYGITMIPCKWVYEYLSDYKRVLKENEQLNKKVDLMENYMVENGWEICFDNIYAELNNCNGMERDWCRGDELEKQDIHKYFSKKLLESEE